MIWWFIFLAVILILVGIAYLRGKCDGFIAGYNTSLFPFRSGRLVLSLLNEEL